MGELWALPIFLRYCLIEFLAHALVTVIRPPDPPSLPAAVPQLPGGKNPLVSTETAAGDTANNDSIANIILSLRSISEQNWSEFFESVSSLEQILREDPAGIYPQMDFKTRDLYRKEIEDLSFATGRDENELAEIIRDLAGLAIKEHPSKQHEDAKIFTTAGLSTPPGSDGHERGLDEPVLTSRAAHIGEFLLGNSRDVLEQRIGFRPDAKTARKRWVLRYAPGFYLSSNLFLTILIFTIIAFAARFPEILGASQLSLSSSPWGVVAQLIIYVLFSSVLLVPVLTVATSLVNWLITLMIKPRILPKLDFKDEIPDPFQTLVVIPAMITSREEIDSLAQQLELHYLRNPQPGLSFALLTDFRDADTETLPEDDGLVEYAVAAIETLNSKHHSPSFSDAREGIPSDGQAQGLQAGDTKRFYFLNRKRLWNPSEKKWIGWERKRGKLHELNLLLRVGKGLSFNTLTADLGAGIDALQSVRFVITLDTDTILPSGAASRWPERWPIRLIGLCSMKRRDRSFPLHHSTTAHGDPPKKCQSLLVHAFICRRCRLDLYSLAVLTPTRIFSVRGFT
jgi:cyclic beta-1,2-glucan synthetase